MVGVTAEQTERLGDSFLSFLLLPRCERFRLAFGCKTGVQFRLSILRQRLEPGERVARRFSERTKR